MQVILVVAVIGAGFDFVPWAQWKYRDYSSANSGADLDRNLIPHSMHPRRGGADTARDDGPSTTISQELCRTCKKSLKNTTRSLTPLADALRCVFCPGTTHEHGWGKCTWTNGQCPSFTSGPICVASPGTQECKDEGRHAMYATTHDAADCAQTCVDPAAKLNCGQYQAIIMDDVQSETRVEWEVGRDIQHFTTWVAGAVALYTRTPTSNHLPDRRLRCMDPF